MIHQADLFFLGQDSLSTKQQQKKNKTIKCRFVQDSQILLGKDSSCSKIN